MKFQFTSKSKDSATKFASHIKAERGLDSSVSEKDGKFFVEYSTADCCYEQPAVSTSTPCGPTYEDLHHLASYIVRELQYQTNWLWAELDYLSDTFYKHKQGHIPPINGAEKMKKALSTLGIAEDYEIIKPVIFASKNEDLNLDFPESKK